MPASAPPTPGPDAVTLLTGEPADQDPLADLAMGEAMLRAAAQGRFEHAVRLYRPRAPMAVFGRRDVRLPGFDAARSLAREAGFTPAVRVTGGRAVAYTSRALVLDVVGRLTGADNDPIGRFERYGGSLVTALGSLGIPAALGAVPGEYCPGVHSVNVRGSAKLVGTAQRVIRGAWLFSTLIILGDADRLRPALRDVYAALGQPFDPASVGSLDEEVPGITVEAVEAAILTMLAPSGFRPCDVDAALSRR